MTSENTKCKHKLKLEQNRISPICHKSTSSNEGTECVCHEINRYLRNKCRHPKNEPGENGTNRCHKFKCVESNSDADYDQVNNSHTYDILKMQKRISRKNYACYSNESSNLSQATRTNIYKDTCKNKSDSKFIKKNFNIKWSKPNFKSRYHTKCTEKTVPKRPVRRIPKIVLASNNRTENIIPKLKNSKKFNNECYCIKYDTPVTCKSSKKVLNAKKSNSDGESTSSELLHDKDVLREAYRIDYKPKTEFLRKLQHNAKKLYDCKCMDCQQEHWRKSLKYTPRREIIEDAYMDLKQRSNAYYYLNHKPRFDKRINGTDKVFRNNIKDSKECIKNEDGNKMYTKKYVQNVIPDFGEPPNLNLLPKKYYVISKVDGSNYLPYLGETSDRIQHTNKIRKDNFFETHATDDLKKNYIQPHRCVHRFELDERLLPVPLHSDTYGTSRCTICSKPMELYKKSSICTQHYPSGLEQLESKTDFSNPHTKNYAAEESSKNVGDVSYNTQNSLFHLSNLSTSSSQQCFQNNVDTHLVTDSKISSFKTANSKTEKNVSRKPTLNPAQIQKKNSRLTDFKLEPINLSRKPYLNTSGSQIKNSQPADLRLETKLSRISSLNPTHSETKTSLTSNCKLDAILSRNSSLNPNSSSTKTSQVSNSNSKVETMLSNKSFLNQIYSQLRPSELDNFIPENIMSKKSILNSSTKTSQTDNSKLKTIMSRKSSLNPSVSTMKTSELTDSKPESMLSRKYYFHSNSSQMRSSIQSSNTILNRSRKVNFGNKSEIVDFNLEPGCHFEEHKTTIKPHLVPSNSLALRYQKGVI